MDYQEFLSAIENGMNIRLTEDTRAHLHTTIKNNGFERKGITIVQEGVNISPTIYLEEFYEQYKKGKSLEIILEKIKVFYLEVKQDESWEGEDIQSLETVSDRIVFKMVNKEKNKELLKMIPYIEFQDLVLIFYVLLEIHQGGTATMLVTNAMQEKWKMSEKELYELAQKNEKRILPAVFSPMQQVIAELLNPCEEKEMNLLKKESEEMQDYMYVLTNEIRSFGAATLAYEHMLEMIAEKLDNSFYILPSSIHEVIIVPADSKLEMEELNETILEINESQVDPEEVLCDHAYYYDRDRKKIVY